jgi:hypothetical protein
MELGWRINSLKEPSFIATEIDIKEILMILTGMAMDFTNTQTNQSTRECGKTIKKMAKVFQ